MEKEITKTDVMTVLIVEPLKAPCVKTIPDGLESLQKIVGGSIEAVYPFEDPVGIICNEEGKLLNLPLNRALFDKNGRIYDIIAGTFLIVGLGEEDFISLSPEMVQKYAVRFHALELYPRF